jgi:hypothetical protein
MGTGAPPASAILQEKDAYGCGAFSMRKTGRQVKSAAATPAHLLAGVTAGPGAGALRRGPVGSGSRRTGFDGRPWRRRAAGVRVGAPSPCPATPARQERGSCFLDGIFCTRGGTSALGCEKSLRGEDGYGRPTGISLGSHLPPAPPLRGAGR